MEYGADGKLRGLKKGNDSRSCLRVVSLLTFELLNVCFFR